MTASIVNLAQIAARYGTEGQIKSWAMPAAAGERLFAMALTEPDYGSDLAGIRTTATKQDDGTYRINGAKRYITHGCGLGPYPSSQLVLARTGQPGGGARGLSVFFVKSEDTWIAGIEHKLGIHASPTCEVVYEDTPGELLGKEGQGLTRCTAGMVNFMRLVSAAGGAGSGAASLFESLKYAQEREQFGRSIDQFPAVVEILERMRRETNAMRLLTLETAAIVDSYQHEQIRMEKGGVPDREIRRHPVVGAHAALADLFTAMDKYYCSETGVALAGMAIQVHGGAGFTEDYDVARFLRDGRINTIYEGTSQIQVRNAVGGIAAGMTGDGNLRQYLKRKLDQLERPTQMLQTMQATLEESIVAYRELDVSAGKAGLRERYSEDLVLMTIRFLTSVYYELAVQKLEADENVDDAVKHRWAYDSRAYQLDSLAVTQAAACRIKNASWVHGSAKSPAAIG